MSDTSETISEEPHRDKLHPGKIGEDKPPMPTLPQEVIRPVSRKDVAYMLIAVIAVFLLANIASGYYLSHYTPNQGYWLIQQKWKLIDQERQASDWLILGDSSCNQGLDPEVWDESLGGRSLNLCTIGNMLLLDDVWMLQSLIRRDLAPKNVLIVHVYDIWSRELNPILLSQVPERRIWSSGNLSVELDWRSGVREAVSRHMPIVGQNAALRRILSRPTNWFRQQHSLSQSGFMEVVEAAPELVEIDAEAHMQAASAERFEISSINRAALNEISRISETYGINVFLVPAPVYEGLLKSERIAARFEEMHLQLGRWSNSGSRLHYLPEVITFSKTDMVNADHLTVDAAGSYTHRIAAVVDKQIIP